jgi:hypothetical protein
MFETTAEVYHHHLRYMYEICTFHYNLHDRCCVKIEYKMCIQYAEMYTTFAVNEMMQELRSHDVVQSVPILRTALNTAYLEPHC